MIKHIFIYILNSLPCKSLIRLASSAVQHRVMTPTQITDATLHIVLSHGKMANAFAIRLTVVGDLHNGYSDGSFASHLIQCSRWLKVLIHVQLIIYEYLSMSATMHIS